MVVSAKTFEQIALEDPEGHWELHCGRLLQKPNMTSPHNDAAFELAYQVRRQLEGQPYRVRSNAGHVKRTDVNYYIP